MIRADFTTVDWSHEEEVITYTEEEVAQEVRGGFATVASDLRLAANEWDTVKQNRSGEPLPSAQRVASALRGAADDLEHRTLDRQALLERCSALYEQLVKTQRALRDVWSNAPSLMPVTVPEVEALIAPEAVGRLQPLPASEEAARLRAELEEAERVAVALYEGARACAGPGGDPVWLSWDDVDVDDLEGRIAEMRARMFTGTRPCEACLIEADIGTEENPHPVPGRFHRCRP